MFQCQVWNISVCFFRYFKQEKIEEDVKRSLSLRHRKVLKQSFPSVYCLLNAFVSFPLWSAKSKVRIREKWEMNLSRRDVRKCKSTIERRMHARGVRREKKWNHREKVGKRRRVSAHTQSWLNIKIHCQWCERTSDSCASENACQTSAAPPTLVNEENCESQLQTLAGFTLVSNSGVHFQTQSFPSFHLTIRFIFSICMKVHTRGEQKWSRNCARFGQHLEVVLVCTSLPVSNPPAATVCVSVLF